MKRSQITLIILGLSGCQNMVDDLNGHYVSIGKSSGDIYETLDIRDSLVLINKNSVFENQRDTIVIDPQTNSFLRSTRVMFPIFDIRLVNDTIEVHYEHDAGQDRTVFIKSHYSKEEDYFSTSYIDIHLLDYDGEELITIDHLKAANLTIGPLKKGVKWKTNNRDSIYIEFENEFFLQRNELPTLFEKLMDAGEDREILCLSFDKGVPKSVAMAIRNELQRDSDRITLTESRSRHNEIVYIK